MRERHFQAANIASAFVWAPLLMLPGYAAARGAEEAGMEQHHLLLAGLGAGVLVLAWMLVKRWRAKPAV
jgi:membrane protein DedA with SNARE-associated domain